MGLESLISSFYRLPYFFSLTLCSENHYLFFYFTSVHCHCRKEKRKIIKKMEKERRISLYAFFSTTALGSSRGRVKNRTCTNICLFKRLQIFNAQLDLMNLRQIHFGLCLKPYQSIYFLQIWLLKLRTIQVLFHSLHTSWEFLIHVKDLKFFLVPIFLFLEHLYLFFCSARFCFGLREIKGVFVFSLLLLFLE